MEEKGISLPGGLKSQRWHQASPRCKIVARAAWTGKAECSQGDQQRVINAVQTRASSPIAVSKERPIFQMGQLRHRAVSLSSVSLAETELE